MNVQTPILAGRRVRLQPMTLEHLPELEAIAFDERIWRYMVEWVRTRHQLHSWMARALEEQAAGTALPWITLLNDGEPTDRIVGATRLTRIDWRHRRAEIGHTWLTPAVHGRGVNTEAKLLQLSFAFDELKMVRVAFRTHHENLQSQTAIQKLGAVYEGTARNHYLMPDGTHRHTMWFAITREAWPAVRLRLERQLAETLPLP